VAIGIGVEGLPVDVGLVGVALLGLALSAQLWWTYFGGDDTRAERAMEEAAPGRRPQLAIDAFGYAHWLMLLGIIAIAAALKMVIGHADETEALAPALFLSCGLAAFLAGDVIFRLVLRIGTGRPRAVAAVLALAAIPLGTEVAGAAQIGAVVLVLGATIAYERTRARSSGGRVRRRPARAL
jgi:low temperature requirement protein LtrA